MRLTLRTLLAYLDDILEPADAKEIGGKIAESPVAAAMAERVREVMRRRRITAPELTGPGSGPDPNLVAEYLDNTLAPESVADIERICLDSDMHLAEVAGCHQILTIVLGEPVDIPPTMRERMYALGAVPASESEAGTTGARTPVPPATADTRRTAAAAAASVQPGEDSFPQQLPEYLRRRPLWRRLAPLAVVVGLAAWLGLVLTDQNFRTPIRTGVSTPPAVPSTEVPEADVPGGGAAPGDQRLAATAPGIEQDQLEPAVPVVVAPSPNPQPPPDVPEPVIEPPPPAVATTEPPAEAALPPDAGAAVPVEAAPPAVAEHAPQIMYTSVEGIALRYQPEMNDWTVLARRALVHPSEWIGSPEPFSTRLDVGRSALTLSVNAGSIVQSVAPLEGTLTALVVDRGRVGLYRPAGPDAAPEPVKVGLHIGDFQFELELLEPGTLCGVEVLLRQPSGISETPADPPFDGGIFVVAGAATLTVNGERLALSRENGWLPWPATNTAWQPGPLLSNPQWLTPDEPEWPAVRQTYAKLYERAFPLDQPVSVSIPAIVKDRRAQISQYAVQTLALTQNIPQLLRALQADHDDARQAAIVGLREWLPRAPENANILREELNRYYRDSEVDPLYELLWGYSPDDLRKTDVSRRLIDWLSHDNLAIRELAIFQIRTGTNRPTDYHPLATPVQRQAAIGRLQDQVRRLGALLPPASDG